VGSLGIKVPLTERRRASITQAAHGPIGCSCDRDLERLGISGWVSLRYRARPSVSSVPPPCADVLVL
jgi:hypothetical protein